MYLNKIKCMAKKNIQLIAKVLCSLLCKMCSAEDSPITSHKKFIASS